MPAMNQLTIRGFDEQLEKRLRELAAKHQISLNRAALTLMRRGAGLTERRGSPGRVGSDLDSFIGVWSEKDESELQRAVEPFEKIDPELWS
jgi:plasmid stability protein